MPPCCRRSRDNKGSLAVAPGVTLASSRTRCLDCGPRLLLTIHQREKLGRTPVPASLQGELQPTIYRFKLGLFEVATILDGKSIREGLHPNFGGNASAASVHCLL